METKINLMGEIKPQKVSKITDLPLFTGSFLIFFLVIVISIGMWTYVYSLNKQKEALNREIDSYIGEVASMKDIEEKKSVVTLKVDELEKLYTKRFDYVKAIDDIQKLFSYTLELESIDLKDDKHATVVANKTGTIVISESQALSTDITEMTLQLNIPSSEELQETVDNLKSFLGKGLTSADVKQSEKREDASGYQVEFLLTFGSLTTIEQQQIAN